MTSSCRQVAASVGLVLFSILPASVLAQDRCDAILEGELFNRVFSESSQQSSYRAAFRTYLFTQTEDEAYEIYERQYDNAISQGQSGSVGVNYFGIGGDVDFKLDYSRKLSRSEFTDKFRRAKAVHEQNSETSTAGESALADSYASYVRDPVTIEAWKTCVTQERPIGIYAYGSRDGSGTPYVNVIWVPGDLAPIYPSIAIDFELPDGTSVPSTNRLVAGGSGRTFRIVTPEAERSIQLFVNAELHNSGVLFRSYSKVAVIPPVTPPSDVAPPVEPDAAPIPSPPVNAMPDLVGQIGSPVVGLLSCVSLEPVDHCLNFLAHEAGMFGIDRRALAEFFFTTTRSGVRPEIVWIDQQHGARIVSQQPRAGTPVPALGTFKIEISSSEPIRPWISATEPVPTIVLPERPRLYRPEIDAGNPSGIFTPE